VKKCPRFTRKAGGASAPGRNLVQVSVGFTRLQLAYLNGAAQFNNRSFGAEVRAAIAARMLAENLTLAGAARAAADPSSSAVRDGSPEKMAGRAA
jgi:hypothetical protein